MAPMVALATEDALRKVPKPTFTALAALGCPRWRQVLGVGVREGWPALAVGGLWAVGRGLGETAALVLTLRTPGWGLPGAAESQAGEGPLNLTLVVFRGASEGEITALLWGSAAAVTAFTLLIGLAAGTLRTKAGRGSFEEKKRYG